MEPSKQVCSLEQAKKLKELGVAQISAFYFYNEFEARPIESYPHIKTGEPVYQNAGIAYTNGIPPTTFVETLGFEAKKVRETYSAFTVAELGTMLKHNIERITFHYGAANPYLILERGLNTFFYAQPNEAQARAELLIFLIANKHIPVSEVNQRLALIMQPTS